MNTKTSLSWDIYAIRTDHTEIHGVMLRGRIRKLGLAHGFTVLCENATDEERCVRFALLHGENPKVIIHYLQSKISDVKTELVLENVKNPVLSKLKVNYEDRYTL
ncbi:MAG TPA: hypothetical protein VD907_01865 [Verrucomicrobiae bacterium]|nr:hypothetical protein [Verrucomicrobiae bacterium]